MCALIGVNLSLSPLHNSLLHLYLSTCMHQCGIREPVCNLYVCKSVRPSVRPSVCLRVCVCVRMYASMHACYVLLCYVVLCYVMPNCYAMLC